MANIRRESTVKEFYLYNFVRFRFVTNCIYSKCFIFSVARVYLGQRSPYDFTLGAIIVITYTFISYNCMPCAHAMLTPLISQQLCI